MKRKIVWSIDPFAGDTTFLNHAAEQISAHFPSESTEVIPVYLLDVEGLGLNSDFSHLDFSGAVSASERALKSAVDSYPNIHFGNPKVISSFEKGVSKLESLMGYTEEVSAEAIVVTTHARKGLERLFLGSFAESLLSASRVPVFLINP